jgi:GR25 family glycosyltransferase involved in LPS biosynthesis
MKIFVIHYDKLIDRKQKIINQMKKYNLNFEFISNHGKENLTQEDKNMFRNLSDGEMSVALHHIECFKRIVSESHECALVLEDDIVLCDNFIYFLNLYIKNLPQNWDMLFIGDGCGLHIDKKILRKNQYIYKKDNINFGNPNEGATRCLDSYIINKKATEIIVEKLKLPNYTICVPADFWMNCVIRNNRFNVYWAEPTIVTQGSEKGFYKSSLR